MIEDLNKPVKSMLNKTFSHLSKPQIQSLSELVCSMMINSNSFTIREFSSYLLGKTDIKHKTKRLVNFLDGLTIDKAYWQSQIKLIFTLPNFRLHSRKHISILLDATTLKDDVWMLAASISYAGRSIPIYIKTWKHVHESYNYWERVELFLKELREILPSKFKYVIVADRGFQGYPMYEILKEYNFDYVIRINTQYCLKQSGSNDWVQLTLFDSGYLHKVELGKTNTIKTNVDAKVVKGENGQKQYFYVMTSLFESDNSIDIYALRMWIEETFKDLKHVLHWEKYTKKFPEKNRLEKLVIISTLSYAIQLCIGSDIEIPPSEYKKNSMLRRLRNAIITQHKHILDIVYTISATQSSYLHKYKYIFV